MTTQTHSVTDTREVRAHSPSASIVMTGERLGALIIVLGVLSGMSIAFAIFSMRESAKSERETRMLQYYVLEMDAKLIASGVKSPGESVAQNLNKGERR